MYWTLTDRAGLEGINEAGLEDGTDCGPSLGSVDCPTSIYYDRCKGDCLYWIGTGEMPFAPAK